MTPGTIQVALIRISHQFVTLPKITFINIVPIGRHLPKFLTHVMTLKKSYDPIILENAKLCIFCGFMMHIRLSVSEISAVKKLV